jgi:arylsulfatase A-like enzyme
VRVAGFLACVLLGGCADGDRVPLRGANGGPANVLLVTVDTLRADHLGAYGYALPTSPAMDALAAEGVRFTEAYTPVPTTAPALASMLTGVYLDEHGVRENSAELPERLATLGEAFAAAGYDTAGFFGNGAIRYGFGQGLRVWEPFAPTFFFTDAAGVTRAIAWLESARSPWFLWIHFMDPHGPYSSSPSARSASFRYPRDPALDVELPAGRANSVHRMIPQYQVLGPLRRVGDYVRRYDGEIAGTDEQIRRLRDALEARGTLDDTLIVLTADHGESLGEDGYYFQHGIVLNDASLRVPLVLRHPALPPGTRVEAPASLLDVMPTVLSLVGLPAPASGHGRDLTPVVFGAPAEPRTLVAYTVSGATQVAVRRDGWKLVGRVRRDDEAPPPRRLLRAAAGREEDVDPSAHAAVAAELERELGVHANRGNPFALAKPSVDPEDRRRLRALGYLDD